jgi:hypothetical protein
VIMLPVWIDDWVCQCSGQTRRVGEPVELKLTFEGDIQAATGPDRIEILDNGQVAIVGTAVGSQVRVGHGCFRFCSQGYSLIRALSGRWPG